MMHMKPADIERRSMEIITGELRERGITLPEENAPVIRRVIHTTADFDYVERGSSAGDKGAARGKDRCDGHQYGSVRGQ